MELQLLSVKDDFDRIERIWLQLQSCSEHSYFLSWGIIGFWLRYLSQQKIPMHCAVIVENNAPVACTIISYKDYWRSKIIRSRSLLLNATGDTTYDSILWIEYNGLLCCGNIEKASKTLLDKYPLKWDELHLNGIINKDNIGTLVCNNSFLDYEFFRIRQLPVYTVYLNKVKENNYDLLSLIKSSTRSQIRRSSRLYTEQYGQITLDAATTVSQALEILEQVFELHRDGFNKRGRLSHFATTHSVDFHKRLIQERFDKNELQLLRIFAGNTVIGCLYNFIYNDKIYFFQSGFHYVSDNRLKPGLLSHVEAIHYNAKQGYEIYDFLGGDERYKRSLGCENDYSMVWGHVQKPRIRFHLEKWLRKKYNRLLKKQVIN